MTVAPILYRALRDGAIFAGAVAVVAGIVGLLVAGVPGLIGGLLGAALSFLYLGLTAVSFLVAGRVTRNDADQPALLRDRARRLGAQARPVHRVRDLAARPDLARPGGVLRHGDRRRDRLARARLIAVQRTRVPYVSDIELPGESRALRAPARPVGVGLRAVLGCPWFGRVDTFPPLTSSSNARRRRLH